VVSRHARRQLADHRDSITRTWLRFPVGHHAEYSNLGIDLAGSALERVTGRTGGVRGLDLGAAGGPFPMAPA
jgi:Beta-lactamase